VAGRASPGGRLIAGQMQIAMLRAAERHRELVAHLHAEGAWLHKAEVMRIGGLPATDEAGLPRDELEILLVADALWLPEWQG
jgi:hypothetical protein